MIKSFAIVSLLTSAAFAQSSGTPSSTANPLIPSGISQPCSDFLTSLNSDKGLTICMSALISATSAYAPGGNGTSSPSASQLQSTLNTLCSSTLSNSCPQSDIRNWITQFYAKCSAELTSNPNDGVKALYDIFYALGPFKTAICSKDDSGKYCVTKTDSGGAQNNIVIPPVVRRADQTAVMPNIAKYQETNLPFLFLQPQNDSDGKPSLKSDSLCDACTRNIFTAYISAESDVPYGPGLSKSILLGKQDDLYKAIVNTCGGTFLSGAVQAAGGLSGGTFPSGAIQNAIVSQSFAALWTGLLMLALYSFF